MKNLMLFLMALFVGCGLPTYQPNTSKKENEKDIVAQMQILQESNFKQYLDYGDRYCKDGYDEVCNELGNIFLDGKRVKKDNKKAEFYLGQACKHNNAKSCQKIAAIFYADKKYDDAIKYLEKSYNLGNLYALHQMGVIAEKAGDTELAAKRYSNACNENLGISCSSLAKIFRQQKENEKSFQLEQKACELKESRGCFNSGVFMYIDKKYDESLDFFKKGCELKNYTSCERAKDLIQKNQILSKKEKDELLEDLNQTISNFNQ